MPNPKPRIESVKRAPAAVLSICLAMTALGASVVGCEGTEESEGLCTSTDQFFAEKVWAPMMSQVCYQCHNGTGAASDTQFVLRASSEAGYLETNLNVVKQVAELERNGQSLILLKPTVKVAHEGGEVLHEGTPEYTNLEKLVQMLKDGNACKTNKASFFAGVALASPKVTLRKATLAIAARVPTDDEMKQVEEKGFNAFGTILDNLMTEEPFFDRIRESYNNQFLTDQYLSEEGLDLLGGRPDEENPEENVNYYNPYWFAGMNGDQAAAQFYGARNADEVEDKLMRQTIIGVAKEPLELIAHVVRFNRPFTEVLTADYFMVNPMSAKAYNVAATFANEADVNEWQEARIDGIPHAGVLTSRMWLERHPTTPTNRNRHRARMVFYDWLGTDILKTAERPLDPTKITDHNPTMNNPACIVCHNNIDPIAGAFENYQASDRDELQRQIGNDDGTRLDFGQADYMPGFTWYQDMRPPGMGSETIPYEELGRSLPWLAQRVTKDQRFPLAVVYQAFRAFIGQEPMLPPTDNSDPEFNAKFQAYLGQYYALSEIADNFVKSNYNFKQIIKDLVMSPYFRGENVSEKTVASQVEKFQEIGTAHLLTPEELDRKVYNVLGYDFSEGDDRGRRSFLLDDERYRLLYGGMNSTDVTTRIHDPNGVMANVAERMGNRIACELVPQDFALPKEQRKWFTDVDAAFAPKDASGFEVSGAVTAIKENIRKLHYKILGEDLAVNDPEIERTYQLFLAAWDGGFKAIQQPQQQDENGNDIGEGTSLPGECTPDFNSATGTYFTDEERGALAEDALYTKRAWMAVFTYLVTDYKFLYE